MIRTALLISFSLGLLAGLFAQGQGWNKILNTPHALGAIDVVAASDGHYYIAGSTVGPKDKDRTWLYKLTSDGEVAWYKEWMLMGRIRRIAALPDGGCLLAGTTFSSNHRPAQMMAARVSPDGALQWEKPFYNDVEQMIALEPLPGRSEWVLLGQGRDNLEEDSFVRLLVIDESGEELWEHRLFGRGSRVFAGCVLPMADGQFVIGGQLSGVGGYVCKIGRQQGLLWESQIPNEGKAFLFKHLVAGKEGKLLAVPKGNRSVSVFELDAEGRLLQSHSLGSAFVEVVQQVLPTPDGGLAILGSQGRSRTFDRDLYLLKLNSALEVEWSRAYSSLYSQEGVGLFPTPSGGFRAFGTQGNIKEPEYSGIVIIETGPRGNTAGELTAPAGPQADGNPLFEPPQLLLQALGYPTITESFDVDADGHVDLLCASEQGHRLEWFAGPDWAPVHLLCENCPGIVELAVTDLNGDGQKDIVAAQSGEPSLVAWINQKGKFGDAQPLIPAMKGIQEILPVDLDQDGDQDLFLGTMELRAIVWLENLDGKGSFSPPQTLTTQLQGVEKMEVARFRENAPPGVLAYAGDCCGKSALHWLEMNDGQLVERQSFSLTKKYGAFTGGDFNRNGLYEFLLTELRSGYFQHYEYAPSQDHFMLKDSIPIGNNHHIYRLHSVDVDQDGWLDVFAETGTVFWMKNEKGRLQDIRLTGSRMTKEGQRISLADRNGDGYLDFLFSAPGQHLVNGYTYEEERDTFTRHPYLLPSLRFSQNGNPVDFDQDGLPDLIVENRGAEELGWASNPFSRREASSFHRIFDETGRWETSEFTVARLENNLPMRVLARYNSTLWLAWSQDGKGSKWERAALSKDIRATRKLEFQDIDLDGRPDLFFGGPLGLYWSRGQEGPADFGPPVYLSNSHACGHHFLLADYNGDGYPDGIAGKEGSSAVAVFLYLPEKQQFQEPRLFTVAEKSATPVQLLDLYQDGQPGILALSRRKILFIRPDGKVEYLCRDAGENLYHLVAAEPEPDGRHRLFFSGKSIGWLEREQGQWKKQTLYTPPGKATTVQSMSLADVDGDGKKDLLAALSSNKLLFFKRK